MFGVGIRNNRHFKNLNKQLAVEDLIVLIRSVQDL